jgi:hypothetical protein
VADTAKRQPAGTFGDLVQVIEELLTATDESGEPNYTLRRRTLSWRSSRMTCSTARYPMRRNSCPMVVRFCSIPPDARPPDAVLAPEG